VQTQVKYTLLEPGLETGIETGIEAYISLYHHRKKVT